LPNRDVGNDAFDPGSGPQQGLQARHGPQCDTMSELGEMGSEAGEQNMVAKTLFAAQNQPFVLEVLPSPGRPWRGRKGLRNSGVEGDAPLVFRPRLAPAAVQQFD